MAEPNTRKKTASAPSGKKPASQTGKKKPSTATTATAESKKPAPTKKKTPSASGKKPSAATATAAAKKPASKKPSTKKSPAKKPPAQTAQKERDHARQEAKKQQKNLFVEQVLPYILIAVALFLVACFILDAIGGGSTPEEHPMGAVGYGICHFLFGCFGWSAYLIPLLFVNLVIFWKRYCEGQLIPVKTVLSVLLLVLVAALSHVAYCTGDEALSAITNLEHLFRTGVDFESGGVIGGLLGYVLFKGLRLAGTVVLSVLVLPLLILGLVGVTPAAAFSKLRETAKARREEAAERRALREAEEEADLANDEREATAERYRERRAKLAEEKRHREELAAEAEEPVYGDEPEEDPAYDEAAYDEAAYGEPDGDVYGDRNQDGGEEAEADGDFIMVDLRTGEAVEPARVGKKKRKAPAEEPEEESYALPFYEPAPAEETAAEAAPAAETAAPEAPAREQATASPASDDGLDDLPDDDDEGLRAQPDTMSVDYGDEPSSADSLTREPTADSAAVHEAAAPAPSSDAPAGVNYEVVTAEETLPNAPAPAASPMTTVRIIRSETSAVAEAGLSEEEVVISTAHAEAVEPTREYVFPQVEMLTRGSSRYEANDAEIAANTQMLREVLESFHIRVKEISCSCGPTITRFEVKPDTGIRVRSIAALVDDIAMNLAKAGVRIEAPIPGRPAVGIEVPNAEPATVYLRNILETPEFRNHKSRIAACLGADVSGRPVILDINKMPHLLIAGATGMGKSVCINSVIMSILYKAKPEEVKLILIDPKKVEFSMYRDLPHLYCPIVSDPTKAAGALNAAVNEMERRFGLIEEVGARNLAGYNEVTADDPERPALPQMVIIIDELADLMMTAPSDVETAICRLAQKARAAGIHLVIGTQRPSVDVITGLIKSNIPSRIAFTVASAVDSRTIIDTVGADKLIGRGDMLYSPVGATKPMRVQGTFVSESEVERVVTFIKEHNSKAEYDESFTQSIDDEARKCLAGKKKGEAVDDFAALAGDGEDTKFWEALEVAVTKDKIGTSALQRALKVGYGRAASIIDRMEELGFVGPDPGTKQGRKVYITKQQLAEYKVNGLPGSREDSGEDGEDGDEL